MQEIVLKDYKNLDVGERLHQDVEAYANNKMAWAKPEEVKLFFNVAITRRLNPLANQIHAVPRKKKVGNQYIEVMEIQTGIDGLRLIAERSNQYSGQVGPYWCGADGKWVDVWLDSKPPKAAKVGVLKRSFTEPLYAIALWDSYAQVNYEGKLTHMWAKMGSSQLAKCAEALALRKAFPEDMGGLYTTDEMDQAVDEKKEREATPKQEPIDKPVDKPKGSFTPTPKPNTPPQYFIENKANQAASKILFGPYRDKTLADIDPAELDAYLIKSNKDIVEGKREKPAWFIDMEKVCYDYINAVLATKKNDSLPPDISKDEVPF